MCKQKRRMLDFTTEEAEQHEGRFAAGRVMLEGDSTLVLWVLQCARLILWFQKQPGLTSTIFILRAWMGMVLAGLHSLQIALSQFSCSSSVCHSSQGRFCFLQWRFCYLKRVPACSSSRGMQRVMQPWLCPF